MQQFKIIKIIAEKRTKEGKPYKTVRVESLADHKIFTVNVFGTIEVNEVVEGELNQPQNPHFYPILRITRHELEIKTMQFLFHKEKGTPPQQNESPIQSVPETPTVPPSHSDNISKVSIHQRGI